MLRTPPSVLHLPDGFWHSLLRGSFLLLLLQHWLRCPFLLPLLFPLLPSFLLLLSLLLLLQRLCSSEEVHAAYS